MVKMSIAALLLLIGLWAMFPAEARAQTSASIEANHLTPPAIVSTGTASTGIASTGTAATASPPPAIPSSLYAQSTAARLASQISGDDVSFLLLDAQTGVVLASRWDDPETPIPMGSLLKPFAALAYGEAHNYRYPMHFCRGAASGCWSPNGHGTVGLSSAIAYSCNSYFRVLTAGITADAVAPTAARYGLPLPPSHLSGAALAGLGASPSPAPWQVSPLQMARAYVELIRRRDQSGLGPVLAGMAQSAREGTAAEVDRALRNTVALAKTGTAPCTHARHAPGDGFSLILLPADRPRFLLLVRVHAVPGAEASATAGRLLRSIQP
jgi:hypothetical protein